MSAVGLPKWPAMVVVGERVTPDQAAQILIRTCGSYLHGNDMVWTRSVMEAFGSDPKGMLLSKEAQERLRILPLEYLENDRITSAWIGGPKGWCDWDGAIGCNSFNIGKWPESDTVMQEWRLVAEAFPFLRLKCQLFDREAGEPGANPVIEYAVANGSVSCEVPQSAIGTPSSPSLSLFQMRLMCGDLAERGCTIEKLRQAIQVTEAALRATP